MLEHPKSDHTIILPPPILAPPPHPTPFNVVFSSFDTGDVQGRCKTASQGDKTKKSNIDFGGGGLKSKIIDIVDLSTYILSEIVDNVRR